MSRVLITAGGTGGHMFPAVELARALLARGHEVRLVTDRRGARFVAADIPRHLIRAGSPTGSPGRKLQGLAYLAVGFVQGLWLALRLRPAAVAALGGYACVPMALAARLLRRPVLVHEQNAVLGRANRLVARRAARLCLSFAATQGAELVPAGRRVVTGNPVRPGFEGDYHPPEPGGRLRILVIGGSQGARVLGQVLPQAVALLSKDDRARLVIEQQCRKEDIEKAAAVYEEAGVAAEIEPFLQDVADRMRRAHLVISRSGASSIAEILALGRPSLLVPYPFAADDHQKANARVLVDAGCAWLVTQNEIEPDLLALRLQSVLDDPACLVPMAEKARALARPDAAQAIAAEVVALIGPRPAGELGREGLA
jgi:UDP-N-acetylglucosamine--N-acetylmuramyl-(pentapeptide) pyrophosphoryl-undecaprenol N-acetylglucosamine transferase